MLRYGIPETRLPREVLRKEVEDLLEMGITLMANAGVGEDIPIQTLCNGYDAVVLGVGLQLSHKIDIPGCDTDGVLWGMDFLRSIHSDQPASIGKSVVVIGGGGVAMDAAMSAIRLGAHEVQVAC